MRLQKLTAAFMTAVLVTSTPAGAYLGQISAYAKEDEEDKDYSISDAAWDEETDENGKTRVYATWSEADTRSDATIVISVDGKKQSTGSIKASTTSGRKELTSYIKKIGKKGTYTFKITAGKKNKGDSEKSYSESDELEVDSEYLKELATGSSSSSSSSSGSSSSSSSGSSKGPGAVTPLPTETTAASPANAGPGQTTAAAEQQAQVQAPKTEWQDWGYGWVYLEDGQLIKDKWIVSNGKFYHLNSMGFMDVNTTVTDSTYGTHFVGADGALMY